MGVLCLLFLSLLNPRGSLVAAGSPTFHPALHPALQEESNFETYKPVDNYRIARNPYVDLGQALQEAKRSHRNVLLEIGGDWCAWCHIMDKFFVDHSDLLALREKNFVTLKVNMSRENENKSFLSQYPKIPGYPHLIVLSAENKLVKSQGTSELKDGKSYNLKRFSQFLQKYSPQ